MPPIAASAGQPAPVYATALGEAATVVGEEAYNDYMQGGHPSGGSTHGVVQLLAALYGVPADLVRRDLVAALEERPKYQALLPYLAPPELRRPRSR